MMNVFLAGLVLAFTAGGFVLSQHGYVNTVKSLAMLLFDHAERLRLRYERRANEVESAWVRRLERAGAIE